MGGAGRAAAGGIGGITTAPRSRIHCCWVLTGRARYDVTSSLVTCLQRQSQHTRETKRGTHERDDKIPRLASWNKHRGGVPQDRMSSSTTGDEAA